MPDQIPAGGPRANAYRGTRHVFVRDLEIMTIIGVHSYEKRARQKILVSVDLTVSEQGPALSDRLEDVLDYGEVARRIEEICAAGHVNLLETLAERVAEFCLRDARVLAVRIRIEKPDVIANARSVGIEIERLKS